LTRFITVIIALFALVASAAAQPARGSKKKGKTHQFKDNRTGKPGLKQGVNPSKIKPTRTEAALKFTVVDKDKGPIPGIVISLTSPKGLTYYTDETDAKGYAEVLVLVGWKYDLVYLSLGRRKISAKVPVSKEPRQTIRLTLRYKRWEKPPQFVLKGVEFSTGKATIRPESFPRLDRVVEYMKHKKSARIEISGHTDNVGNRRRNKALSKRRARACRKYLTSKGIAGSRIRALGYGDERPIASNSTEDGRQKNRRIEASELAGNK
jgi:outer membrane protein OmpA-like peptidoglycan-associated protein